MFQQSKSLELFFRIVSYGVAGVSLLTLVPSGSIGVGTALCYLTIVVLAWKLEGSTWQISEKIGVALILLVIPVFYADWNWNISGFSSRDTFAAGNLSRLILALSAIKLLQRKTDRDWIILYLISFFEVLLAAAVGISPLFLLCLLSYLLVSFVAIILFDFRNSSNSVLVKSEKRNTPQQRRAIDSEHLFRLPLTATFIFVVIALFAVPLFFLFPRVGGAGFGSNLQGLSGFTGFSDSVKLGEIGKLQQNDEVVMRIRLSSDATKVTDLKWRGVALDAFDGQTWKKTKGLPNQNVERKGDYFVLETRNDVSQLITQTIYLEPIDTPVLFALSHPVALQGRFDWLSRDSDGSLSAIRSGYGRVSYKVLSDDKLPNAEELSSDNQVYSSSIKQFLELPSRLDERIPRLTKQILAESGARTRFDQVKAVEHYLQNSFGYTLDLKAGGSDPLADFLFNVREGHCEYFASALAIMLRTQGIATRVVNGFSGGEYNETADVYVVKQKHAHSWVEVYFPKSKTWVPFDATPAAGQSVATAGIASSLNRTLEALETFWIQYVVSYDNIEQRSVFSKLRSVLIGLRNRFSIWFDSAREALFAWWQNVRGDQGLQASFFAIGTGIGYVVAFLLSLLLLIRLWRRIKEFELWRRIRSAFRRKKQQSVVEFYQRMQKVLAKRGIVRQAHQTPLEFAYALQMPQALKITEKYNEVRFGEKNLSAEEADEIDHWLKGLEEK